MGGDVSTARSEELVPSINRFAFRFYKTEAASRDGGDNLVFSPSCLLAGLALMRLGSAGRTAEEIDALLGADRFEDADLHQAAAAMRALLFEPGHSYRCFGASRLYAPADAKISKRFRKLAMDYYRTLVEGRSFEDRAASVEETNRWAVEAMEHSVPRAVDEGCLDAGDRLVLLTGLDFRGRFEFPFHRAATKVAKFFVSASEGYNVPMMNVKRSFPYLYDSAMGCRVVELPYRENHFRMIVVLPDEAAGLSQVESRLTVEVLQRWCRPREVEVVDVHLPRFRVGRTIVANGTLGGMGVVDLFDPRRADLSGVGRDLHLSKFVHFSQARAEEEEAAEGDADRGEVDVHGFVVTYETFRAERPFLFFVQDKRKGAIVFMGRQTRPPAIDKEELREIFVRAKQRLRAKADGPTY